MKDTYKAVLVLVLVPVLVTLGFTEACSNEIIAIVSTIGTGAAVVVWKFLKK